MKTEETYIKYELQNQGSDGNWYRATGLRGTQTQAEKKFRDYIREQRKSAAALRGFLPDDLCATPTKYRLVLAACTIINQDFKP